MPKISLIIPVLNEAKLLKGLLTYLKSCDPENQVEIIVVDGNSTDNTCKIAENEELTLVKSSLSSRAHQMNLGAKAATTDIYYFVHADVFPPAPPPCSSVQPTAQFVRPQFSCYRKLR